MADIYYPLLLNSPEDSEEDDAEVRVHHIPKRYIRDALNPLEFYRDVEFKRRRNITFDTKCSGKKQQPGITSTASYAIVALLKIFRHSQFSDCCW
ncbi:unnamed protein product [Tenebrio molitor]|nr:unnamed protein product [Tenebrio molitor]